MSASERKADLAAYEALTGTLRWICAFLATIDDIPVLMQETRAAEGFLMVVGAPVRKWMIFLRANRAKACAQLKKNA
jgi:hypothetical protein